MTFTFQNERPLEIENKANLTWHIILQNQEQENMSKGMDFFIREKFIQKKLLRKKTSYKNKFLKSSP